MTDDDTWRTLATDLLGGSAHRERYFGEGKRTLSIQKTNNDLCVRLRLAEYSDDEFLEAGHITLSKGDIRQVIWGLSSMLAEIDPYWSTGK